MSEKLVTEEFLDTYEGEVMFLSQDLEELIEKLEEGNLDNEALEVLSQNLLDVSDVFLSSTYTQHISPIFKDFAAFIETLSIEKLLEHEESIEHLHAILSDVNTYIEQYFIGRVFSDVYLFQDSLKNSIEFFKASYRAEDGNTSDDDGSEVLFL